MKRRKGIEAGKNLYIKCYQNTFIIGDNKNTFIIGDIQNAFIIVDNQDDFDCSKFL